MTFRVMRSEGLGALGFGTAISGIVACASLLSVSLLAVPHSPFGLGADERQGSDIVVPTPEARPAPASVDAVARLAATRAVAGARDAAVRAEQVDRTRSRSSVDRRRTPAKPAAPAVPARSAVGSPLSLREAARDLSTTTGGTSGAGLDRPTTPAAAAPVASDEVTVATPVVAVPAAPAAAIAARKVRLRLADLALTPATGAASGSLRLRYAVQEESDTRTLPETVDVTLQVPEVTSRENMRVSVDLVHDQAGTARLRVRVSLVDENTVATPTVAETATASEGSSNTLDVVTPLDATQSGEPQDAGAEGLPPVAPEATPAASVEVPVLGDATPGETVAVPVGEDGHAHDEDGTGTPGSTVAVTVTVTASDPPPPDPGASDSPAPVTPEVPAASDAAPAAPVVSETP